MLAALVGKVALIQLQVGPQPCGQGTLLASRQWHGALYTAAGFLDERDCTVFTLIRRVGIQ